MDVYDKLYAANMNNDGEQFTAYEVHSIREMIDRLRAENERLKALLRDVESQLYIALDTVNRGWRGAVGEEKDPTLFTKGLCEHLTCRLKAAMGGE